MKKSKLISITLALILVMLNISFLEVDADSNIAVYEIPELLMTMDIPTGINIATREIKQSDPLFLNNTFDYIQTMSKFRDNNDYIYGKDLSGSIELEVMAKENESGIENLTKLSEKKQQSVLNSVSEQSDILESSIYKTDSNVFVEVLRSSDDSLERIFTKEYYTIYNKKDIIIKLSSSNDNLTSQELDLLKSIVDSVRFPKEKTVNISKAVSKSEMFLFCTITVSFVILVINKVQNIKKEKRRLERIQKRKMTNSESNANHNLNSVQDVNKTNSTEQAKESLKSIESAAIEEKLIATKSPNNDISQDKPEQEPEIDLDAAISNFESSLEARKERRERNKEKNKKKSKLPFGK